MRQLRFQQFVVDLPNLKTKIASLAQIAAGATAKAHAAKESAQVGVRCIDM